MSPGGLARRGGAQQGRGSRPGNRGRGPEGAWPLLTVAAPVCQEGEGTGVGLPEHAALVHRSGPLVWTAP